jgi:hypothetical protein
MAQPDRGLPSWTNGSFERIGGTINAEMVYSAAILDAALMTIGGRTPAQLTQELSAK